MIFLNVAIGNSGQRAGGRGNIIGGTGNWENLIRIKRSTTGVREKSRFPGASLIMCGYFRGDGKVGAHFSHDSPDKINLGTVEQKEIDTEKGDDGEFQK